MAMNENEGGSAYPPNPDVKSGSCLIAGFHALTDMCDGEWDAGQVVAHWPQVHAWHSDENTRDWVRVVGIMLAEKAERGEEVETLINMLGRGSRPKVREFLRAPMVELPPDCAAAAVAEARSWCARFE